MRRVTINKMSRNGHDTAVVDLDIEAEAEQLVTDLERFLRNGGEAYVVTKEKGVKKGTPLDRSKVTDLPDETELMLRPRLVGG